MASTYQDLNEFLAKHSTKNTNSTVFTHTRIPDKELNIFPGSYLIPKEDANIFYSLYYDSVFVKKRKEYLTEKQLDNGGPMAVDFDFRYNYHVNSRQHNKEDILNMVCEYLEKISECYISTLNTKFDVFIFEKPTINRLEDKSLTKDGIHMIIGLQIDHTMQMIIREKMIEEISCIWDNLPLINDWNSVLDEGISKGHTNWQLFGSRKPGNEAYELTYHISIVVDESDGEFKMIEKDVKKFDLKNNYEKLSIQYEKNPKLEMNPKIIDEYNKRNENNNLKKKKSSKIKMNLINDTDADVENEDYIAINDIKDAEKLSKAINIMLDKLELIDYEIKETHEFAQALPKKYYESGSHALNRQVAFALKHTNDKLFLSWVMLRSKATDFDYNTIPELFQIWNKLHKSNSTGECVTRKSIMYWLRKENFEEYEKIQQNTIKYYIEKALETGTEYDFALILKQMYKDKYVCVSYEKKGIWFQFKNHRWIHDKGLSLRSKISLELFNLFKNLTDNYQSEMQEYADDDARRVFLKNKIKLISELTVKLRRTIDKNNIMREAAEIFYDGEFIKNMDTNKYLMCFDNGVIDFNNKIFREGYPEDYITKTTKINYIMFENLSEEQKEEYNIKCDFLKDFMNKLFPIVDLNKYMWDHLSSCLIGTNKNQTFNVYHGSGSNGKSILADLMSLTLGEYKGTVPITLVTEKRGLIGGTSDEVLKLKGVRYAVMQEPSKGVKLNEGIMKELTGGDPIQARGLYSESEIFDPQFNLVVCTNNLFDIESNDDGTWRRIRNCDFISKFVDEGEIYNDETKYVYPKDKSLKDKLPMYASIFASMLIKRAFETNGIVEDCATVLNASNKYRRNQDHITAFISECVTRTNNKTDKIKKTELIGEFKKWFENHQSSKKIPKGNELFEYINTKLKFTQYKTGWSGVKINYPEEEHEEEEED